MGRGEGKPQAGGEVVGIVGDVKELGLDQEHPARGLRPHAQFPAQSMDVVLRTARRPPVARPRRWSRSCTALDPELPVARAARPSRRSSRARSPSRASTCSCSAPSRAWPSAPGRPGHLRRHVLRRRAALARDRHPGGAGRAAGATSCSMVLRHAARPGRRGRGGRAWPAPWRSPARSPSLLFELSPTDPATLAGVAVAAGRGRPPRQLPARAPRHARRSRSSRSGANEAGSGAGGTCGERGGGRLASGQASMNQIARTRNSRPSAMPGTGRRARSAGPRRSVAREHAPIACFALA